MKKVFELLPQLFDIGLPHDMQPSGMLDSTISKRDFLKDQQNQRKCFLPPVTRKLGVEVRRDKREAAELKRQEKKAEETEECWRTSGTACPCHDQIAVTIF
jgi:hypothetical protein